MTLLTALTIVLGLALWIAAGFLLGPIIGRRLRRAQDSQSYPLPSGSLRRDDDRLTS